MTGTFETRRLQSNVKDVSDRLWIQPLSFLLAGLGWSLILSFAFFFCEIRIVALCVYIAGNRFYIRSQHTQKYTLVPSLLSAVP